MRRKIKLVRGMGAALLLLGILIAFGGVAAAQTVVSGELTGTVTDPSGAVVANAKLTLTSEATGEVQSSVTGPAGQFRFSLLRPGTYTLIANATGFAEITQKA